MSVALVTGVGGGIGAAIASRLANAGAAIAVTDLPDALDAYLTTQSEPPTLAQAADLGNASEVSAMVASIQDQLGALTTVVTAAGGVCGQSGQPLAEVSDSDWHRVFDANVHGAFHLARACLPAMGNGGRFVTIASGAGLRPSLTGVQAYTASKHALVGLTRQLAQEFGPSGITVNAVAPGFVLSNTATRRQWDAYGAAGQQQLVERIHTRRLGTPDDIAAAVVFLCSEDASWITGQVLCVDGGVA